MSATPTKRLKHTGTGDVNASELFSRLPPHLRLFILPFCLAMQYHLCFSRDKTDFASFRIEMINSPGHKRFFTTDVEAASKRMDLYGSTSFIHWEDDTEQYMPYRALARIFYGYFRSDITRTPYLIAKNIRLFARQRTYSFGRPCQTTHLHAAPPDHLSGMLRYLPKAPHRLFSLMMDKRDLWYGRRSVECWEHPVMPPLRVERLHLAVAGHSDVVGFAGSIIPGEVRNLKLRIYPTGNRPSPKVDASRVLVLFPALEAIGFNLCGHNRIGVEHLDAVFASQSLQCIRIASSTFDFRLSIIPKWRDGGVNGALKHLDIPWGAIPDAARRIGANYPNLLTLNLSWNIHIRREPWGVMDILDILRGCRKLRRLGVDMDRPRLILESPKRDTLSDLAATDIFPLMRFIGVVTPTNLSDVAQIFPGVEEVKCTSNIESKIDGLYFATWPMPRVRGVRFIGEISTKVLAAFDEKIASLDSITQLHMRVWRSAALVLPRLPRQLAYMKQLHYLTITIVSPYQLDAGQGSPNIRTLIREAVTTLVNLRKLSFICTEDIWTKGLLLTLLGPDTRYGAYATEIEIIDRYSTHTFIQGLRFDCSGLTD